MTPFQKKKPTTSPLETIAQAFTQWLVYLECLGFRLIVLYSLWAAITHLLLTI